MKGEWAWLLAVGVGIRFNPKRSVLIPDRIYGANVMLLRGMGHTISIPRVALRSTHGYSHGATNVANNDRVAVTFE
jgi:hypothetical protein